MAAQSLAAKAESVDQQALAKLPEFKGKMASGVQEILGMCKGAAVAAAGGEGLTAGGVWRQLYLASFQKVVLAHQQSVLGQSMGSVYQDDCVPAHTCATAEST